MIFTIVFPIVLYVLFSSIFGGDDSTDVPGGLAARAERVLRSGNDRLRDRRDTFTTLRDHADDIRRVRYS